jgi:hypothetical protein
MLRWDLHDGLFVVVGWRVWLYSPTISAEVGRYVYYALPLPRHPLSVGSHKTSHILVDERDRL